MRFWCWLRGHRWDTMTIGRGFVWHELCLRRCGASRIRKGSDSWRPHNSYRAHSLLTMLLVGWITGLFIGANAFHDALVKMGLLQ